MQCRFRQLMQMLFAFLVLGIGMVSPAYACKDQIAVSYPLEVKTVRFELQAATGQNLDVSPFRVLTSADSNNCDGGVDHCCMAFAECARICVGAALPPVMAVDPLQPLLNDFDWPTSALGTGLTPAPDGDPPRASSRS